MKLKYVSLEGAFPGTVKINRTVNLANVILDVNNVKPGEVGVGVQA